MATSDRQTALADVKVGDVVYGISAAGHEKLLLVIDADADRILTRHVTSQSLAEFGRDGRSRRIPTGGSCTIVSTAALPVADHAVAVGIDRKMRAAKELTDLKLSKEEIDLILSYGEFYKARLLPD